MCVLKQPSASRLLGVHREIRTTRTCRNAIHFLWFLGVIREWGTARQIWLICLCVICICCPSFYAYLYFLRIELRVHREWGSWSVHILYLYCRLYFVWHVFVIVIRGFTHTESGGGATLDRRTLGLAVHILYFHFNLYLHFVWHVFVIVIRGFTHSHREWGGNVRQTHTWLGRPYLVFPFQFVFCLTCICECH